MDYANTLKKGQHLALKNGFEGPGELKITGRISAINHI